MTIKHPEDFAGLEPPPTPDLVKIADALVRSMALSPTSDKARAAGLLTLRTSAAGYQPPRVTEFYRMMAEWCAEWAEEGK